MAQDIAKRFKDEERQRELVISSLKFLAVLMPADTTMWAILAFLGVEKKGTELYQITLGALPMNIHRLERSLAVASPQKRFLQRLKW